MFTVGFWRDTGERAIATFAQVFLAFAGGDFVGVVEFDWAAALSLAAMGAVLAVFKGLAASAVSSDTGASFGTTIPKGSVAAVEAQETQGAYQAEEASPYPDGTPVDVVPDVDRYESNAYQDFDHTDK